MSVGPSTSGFGFVLCKTKCATLTVFEPFRAVTNPGPTHSRLEPASGWRAQPSQGERHEATDRRLRSLGVSSRQGIDAVARELFGRHAVADVADLRSLGWEVSDHGVDLALCSGHLLVS